jgi:hypothetical protein
MLVPMACILVEQVPIMSVYKISHLTRAVCELDGALD